jgi:hypothetical protein
MAITAETPDMQDEINLVWKYILPAMHDGTLPADKEGDAKLEKKLTSLALPVPAKSTITPSASLTGKAYTVQANDKKIQSLTFSLQGDIIKMNLTSDKGDYSFDFGNGQWKPGTTTLMGPYLVAAAKNVYKGLPALKVDGAYTWTDDHTLELTLRYIESPHTEKLVCSFSGNNVTVDVYNSYEYGSRKTTLTGEAK